MKKIGMLTVAVAFAGLWTGCSGDARHGEALLAHAQASFEAGNYNLAKLQIDSIRTLYPKAFDARKAAIKLMQQVELKEQEKSLVYLDSMMVVKQASLDSIKGEFVFEKDTAYQDMGNYFYPTQTVEKNIGRSFLRAQVNEDGEMSLTSIYSGPTNIHHTSVKVSVGDNFAETPTSPDIYETTDLGEHIEKADYKLGADGGVIAFIASHADSKNVRLEFRGDRNYATLMRPDDVKAVAAVGNLARILSAIKEIKDDKEKAQLKIRFVNRQIEQERQLKNTK